MDANVFHLNKKRMASIAPAIIHSPYRRDNDDPADTLTFNGRYSTYFIGRTMLCVAKHDQH